MTNPISKLMERLTSEGEQLIDSALTKLPEAITSGVSRIRDAYNGMATPAQASSGCSNSSSLGSGSAIARPAPSSSIPTIQRTDSWGFNDAGLMVDGAQIIDDALSIKDLGNSLFLVHYVTGHQVVDTDGNEIASNGFGQRVLHNREQGYVELGHGDGSLTVVNVKNEESFVIKKKSGETNLAVKKVYNAGAEWFVEVRSTVSDSGSSRSSYYEAAKPDSDSFDQFMSSNVGGLWGYDFDTGSDGRLLLQQGDKSIAYDHGRTILFDKRVKMTDTGYARSYAQPTVTSEELDSLLASFAPELARIRNAATYQSRSDYLLLQRAGDKERAGARDAVSQQKYLNRVNGEMPNRVREVAMARLKPQIDNYNRLSGIYAYEQNTGHYPLVVVNYDKDGNKV